MKNRISLAIALLVIVPLIAQLGIAQLFPNAPWNRGRSVQSVQSCPGDVCPSVQRQNALRSVQRSTHWSYPGASIASHLATGHAEQLRAHGINTSGMSQEQLLSLHDALHENRFVPRAVNVVAPQPVVPQRAKPQPARTVLPVSQSTFGLGYATEPIPNHVLAQVGERTEVRSEFKKSLLDAISAARRADKITLREAVQLRVACISPAFVERAQNLAVTQLAFSGEASEHIPTENGVIQVEGINWEGLAKFLEVFIPLLVTLLKAFGL